MVSRFDVFFAFARNGLTHKEIETILAQFTELAQGITFTSGKLEHDPLNTHILDQQITLMLQCSVLFVDMSVSNRNYIGAVVEMVKAKEAGMPIVVYAGKTGYEQNNSLLYLTTDVHTDYAEAIKKVEEHIGKHQ